jgi:hypothetical protein
VLSWQSPGKRNLGAQSLLSSTNPSAVEGSLVLAVHLAFVRTLLRDQHDAVASPAQDRAIAVPSV